MNINKCKSILTKMMAGAALTAGMASCDIMHDDTPPCSVDPGLRLKVNFVYDYNMDDEDLFDRQAGSVYLYVFDEQGTYLTRYEKNKVNLDPSNPDFSMYFDVNTDNEFFMGRKYQFAATAQGSHVGYDGDDETPGYKLVNEMIPGVSTINDYIIKLNRDDKMFSDFGVVDYTQDYSGKDAMIDSVWTTKPNSIHVEDIPVYVADFDSPIQKPDSTIEIKIPMLRITNNIKVTLAGPRFTENTDPKHYDILLYYPHGNGTIGFTGERIDSISQPLYYRALRKYVDVYQPHEATRADASDSNNRGNYAIYAEFGVSRMFYDDESELQVRDPLTHEIIAKIPNFSQYLADKAAGYAGMEEQEYLDREFNFSIDLGLDEYPRLWWSQVGIGVLGWSTIDWYVGL